MVKGQHNFHVIQATLQNKLAKLANTVVDILIKEMNIHLAIPQDTSPMKSDLHN
jgi:hypothetical protein